MLVAHTGFEPVVSSLRGTRPRPLDECARTIFYYLLKKALKSSTRLESNDRKKGKLTSKGGYLPAAVVSWWMMEPDLGMVRISWGLSRVFPQLAAQPANPGA